MHELTRVRAYARLIVAIAGDKYGTSDARSVAIDTLVNHMIDTAPADHICHAQATMVYCEACTVPA